MASVAIIPARGGSKGVPGKNKRLLGGVPLIARSIMAAKNVSEIDHVCVSSDDDEILQIAEDWGAIAIKRPDKIAGDTATSEAALFHALDELDKISIQADIAVFLQCTSPFTTSQDISKNLNAFKSKKADCAFSVTNSHGFLWAIGENGFGAGINHDHNVQRKRRQDLEPEYLETGAIYVLNVSSFKKVGHRFCGKLLPVPIESPALEIDTLEDWEIADSICHLFPRVYCEYSGLKNIKTIVMDFDGVHTDDRVIVNELGQEAVICSRKDGMGLEQLRNAGFQLLILSKETNVVVVKRAQKLQIEVIHGVEKKVNVLEKWLNNNDLDWGDIAFVGNDVNDIDCIKKAAVGICPSDAVQQVKSISDIILPYEGGKGALRYLADRLLSFK